MRPDVIDLTHFYNSPLGQVARRMIRRRIRDIWSDVRDMDMLGLGFATPYLRAFKDEARHTIGVMPANQGVMHWPRDGLNLVTLSHEYMLPFDDGCFDRVLMVHSIETSDHIPSLLSEVWRVLAPGGRLMVVVPNRRGIWSRTDHTPFGHGRPYSSNQVTDILREAMFNPEQLRGALYMPPSDHQFLMRFAVPFERLGGTWWKRFSGVTVVEASKQVYAMSGGAKQRAPRPILVPMPNPIPTMQGAGAMKRDRNKMGTV